MEKCLAAGSSDVRFRAHLHRILAQDSCKEVADALGTPPFSPFRKVAKDLGEGEFTLSYGMVMLNGIPSRSIESD